MHDAERMVFFSARIGNKNHRCVTVPQERLVTLCTFAGQTDCWFTNVNFLMHRKQIQDLNWQRKNDQLAGGAKLRELESKYVV